MSHPIEDRAPFLRVVRGGEPTAAEVAALVIALTARRQPGSPQPASSAWSDRAAALRQPLPRGRDAWRMSARPGARRA